MPENSHQTPPVVAGQTTAYETVELEGRTYRYYRVPDADRILYDMDPDEWERSGEPMPYWAEVWPSGKLLSRLLARAGDLKGARVLELGCGLGLPSIVAASLGAYATASDYMPEALALLETNAALNDVQVNTRLLDWNDPGDIGRYDLVMAGDVLYETWQADAIADLLKITVHADGKALIVDQGRETARQFANVVTYRGFRVVKRSGSLPDFATDLTIYDLEWRR